MQQEQLYNESKVVSGNALESNRSLVDKFYPLWHLVGNTPMVEVVYMYRGQRRSIFAKCEHYNLTGSIKDRVALYILQQAYLEERIKPSDTIVEATCGNSAVSIAAIGRRLGHKVMLFMPDWLQPELYSTARSLGAQVITVSREEGGMTACMQRAEAMAADNSQVFYISQFTNKLTVEAHERTTGFEIWKQLRVNQISPDAFIAGVGTGGTVMGVGNYLRERKKTVRIHPLEPVEFPILSGKTSYANHRIDGVAQEIVPPIVDLEGLDTVVRAHDGDAILMARKLTSELGFSVGISSGANFVGAIRVQTLLGAASTVVTVFCDNGNRYSVNNDLGEDVAIRPGYLTPKIKFVEYKPISRLYASVL